jgi:glycosyltransferase involved in cell wall biosynthesis
MSASKTIVLVHQNIPAQFRNLAPALAAAGHRVFFVTNGAGEVRGTTKVHYQIDKSNDDPNVIQVQYAQRVGRALVYLKEKLDVVPDLIIGHVSWGELMFVRDIYPHVPLIGYFEWFHHLRHISQHPDGVGNPNAPFVFRVKNVPNYVCWDICNLGITPTWWQHSTFPKEMQSKLNVVHDGVDTVSIRRPERAALRLQDGRVLTSEDEVVTYVARGLEPVRGFPTFIRSVAELCRRRPNCHVLIIGKETTSYGNPLPDGQTYKGHLLKEVAIDESRVHFLGWVDYQVLLQAFYISSAHVYLTMPFILSWSFMEAMAAECLVIGSRTPPVEEVIVDGHNGLLVDFSDHLSLAERISAVLDKPGDYEPIRREARRTILERYDLHGICLPRQKALIASLL